MNFDHEATVAGVMPPWEKLMRRKRMLPRASYSLPHKTDITETDWRRNGVRAGSSARKRVDPRGHG